MRVLWFTNTPSLAANYLNSDIVGGGWIQSLEAELIKISSIELGIAFNIVNNNLKRFIKNQTVYYPVNRDTSKNRFQKIASNWNKSLEKENNIQPYLDIIEDFKPDIINIFGTEGPFGLIIKNTNIPCIIHIQGNLNLTIHKWFNGITKIEVIKYSKKFRLLKGNGVYHDYFLIKKRAEREKEIFQNCKFFMGRTDWDKRISSVLSPQSNYFHCEEMMRPNFYTTQWIPKESKSEYTIITTIRNNIYKGLEMIFESKRILDSINLSHKIIWKIAGLNKSDEIVNIIERKYKSKFSENNILLLGSLNESNLIEEMLMSDVFIHPSNIDNSPNSLCEAMLIGMPVISTYAGGIPSIVENKKDGLLVQNGDPYALAGAIKELVENRDYANRLGNTARNTATRRHNPTSIVNNLINIYNKILN